MTSNRLLVTGSQGRIGRALQRAAAGTFEIVGTTSPGGPAANLAFDVADSSATMRVVAEIKPRVIVHLAAMIGGSCEADPQAADRVNVGGTANLAAAAIEHGVERIVFASTAGVYGDARRRPVAESDDTAPVGVYSKTKLLAERVLAKVSSGVHIDVLRIFNVYGDEMPDSLISRLHNATVDTPVRLTGLEEFVRDYVHVDDVAKAFVAAADSAHTGFRVLNVGSGVPRSNGDLLKAIPVADKAAIVLAPPVESYSCADVSTIRRELSWQPLEPWPPPRYPSLRS